MQCLFKMKRIHGPHSSHVILMIVLLVYLSTKIWIWKSKITSGNLSTTSVIVSELAILKNKTPGSREQNDKDFMFLTLIFTLSSQVG